MENVINKEKILQLPEKQSIKDKKRRRTTHFTASKNKKRIRQRSLIVRKGLKSLGKGKKMIGKRAVSTLMTGKGKR